jgi:cephalosporin hydroxylase
VRCESVPPGGELFRPPLAPSRWSFEWLVCSLLSAYNKLHRTVLPRRGLELPSMCQELREIREFAERPSDINEHLEIIFTESLLIWPRLIVELGVRAGVSTFVFERVASVCGASIISADIDDCSSTSSHPRRHFFQGDDVQFAAGFSDYCRERDIAPSVDVLFIDTSHYYDHTVQEIQAWFPLLSPRAKVLFHDTNLRLIGPRRDGCFALAWDNERGVVRAIEAHLGIRIDESKECTEYNGGWLIRHWPHCNGFMVLDKFPGPEEAHR